jgi:chromatin remodeling complex protein RSC6
MKYKNSPVLAIPYFNADGRTTLGSSKSKNDIAFSPAEGHLKGMAKTLKRTKRTPNAAFMKPVTPDETLAKVVGNKPLPRTELTKRLWAYIKKNGLQDGKKKTLINADEALKAVFNGKKQASMFEMTKLVSGHVKN